MWVFLGRVVLILGAFALGKQVLNERKKIDPLKLYSIPTVSRLLGIKIEEVDELVKTGRLAVKEVGEKSFVLGKDLLRFLN